MNQTLSESASFYDKTFWFVFRFTVLTVVHLQNANAMLREDALTVDITVLYCVEVDVHKGVVVPGVLDMGRGL